VDPENIIPCAIWNEDKNVWVVPTANDLKPTTLPTVVELVDKLGAPIKVRYPGKTELVDQIL
jgi:hypothetical protein